MIQVVKIIVLSLCLSLFFHFVSISFLLPLVADTGLCPNCYNRRPAGPTPHSTQYTLRLSSLSMSHLLSLHIADLSMLPNYNSHKCSLWPLIHLQNVFSCSIRSVHRRHLPMNVSISLYVASLLWVTTAEHCSTTPRESCDLYMSPHHATEHVNSAHCNDFHLPV